MKGKRRKGLNKPIKSIFKGVCIPEETRASLDGPSETFSVEYLKSVEAEHFDQTDEQVATTSVEKKPWPAPLKEPSDDEILESGSIQIKLHT